jgi:hypothetical protein
MISQSYELLPFLGLSATCAIVKSSESCYADLRIYNVEHIVQRGGHPGIFSVGGYF